MKLGTGAIKGWCWGGVGGAKIPGSAGRFHVNSAGHQPALSHWSNFIGETYLTQYGTTMNWFLRGVGRAGCWIGKIGDQSHPRSLTEQENSKYGNQSSDPSKVVIHKDEQRRQLHIGWLELTCEHMASQALAAIPEMIETAGWIDSR